VTGTFPVQTGNIPVWTGNFPVQTGNFPVTGKSAVLKNLFSGQREL
jgi:hypothetical protein